MNQKGFAPIILIIILIILAAILGTAYKSSKESSLKTNKAAETKKTTKVNETTEIVDTTNTTGRVNTVKPNNPTNENKAVELANSSKLAEKPIELKVDNKATSSPKFSIIPPGGWEKLPARGNYLVEFVSPSIDIAKEGYAYLKMQPNVIVFVLKEDFKDLDEATAILEKSIASSTSQKNRQKTTINGEEATIIEFTTDITASLREEMEIQLKQTIATSGAKVSEETLRKDMDKLFGKTKTKLLSYSFYKNGYYVNVVGRGLESFWDQRQPVIKASLDTFKFIE